MKIGIDVTWLKPKKSGGVESFFRNIMDGFLSQKDKNYYVLFVALDNYDSLKEYEHYKNVKLIKCNVKANNAKSHLLWQNLFFYKYLKKEKVDLCYFPVYQMPFFKYNKIKTVVTIHDIQAIHFKEYFKKLEYIFLKYGWIRSIKTSDKVVTISEFTKNDIIEHFGNNDKIECIYNPISIIDNKINNDNILNKFNVKKNEYFYTICSMHKHKNLITLLKVMKKIKEDNINIPKKLLISGVNGPNKDELVRLIDELDLNENIVLTGFVSNDERNTLIKLCNTFLFPSIFEGFGMPPVEAMYLGSRVLTTKSTSLYEVTKGTVNYIDNPIDFDEWINELKKIQKLTPKKYSFEEYTKEYAARKYLDLFYEVKK